MYSTHYRPGSQLDWILIILTYDFDRTGAGNVLLGEDEEQENVRWMCLIVMYIIMFILSVIYKESTHKS